jgi:hypothetical protein
MASFAAGEHACQDTAPQDLHARQLAQRVAETGDIKDLQSYLDAGGLVEEGK